MTTRQFLPQLPYGTKDILPGEAWRKRVMENDLAALFTRWGYDEVVTPTFEYLDTLSNGAGDEAARSAFKFFDKNNSLLALRSDMTTPIARVAATRLRETSAPLRLFYIANVFRHEQAQAGRQCEFYQAGVELLGAGGPAADAEVVALAVEALLEAGLSNFKIGLGQVGFINGILGAPSFSPAVRQRVKQNLLDRDFVGLEATLQGSGLEPELQRLIRQIPLSQGGEGVLLQAEDLAQNEISGEAINNLVSIRDYLRGYGMEEYVTFDLGLIRDFDYYTGMVFEAYTPGLGFPLCGGGRYDKMVAAFGVDCPATGFAFGIERVLLALARQGIDLPAPAKDVYIAWSGEGLQRAIEETVALRKKGKTVELALEEKTQGEASAEQLRRGYLSMRFFDGSHD